MKKLITSGVLSAFVLFSIFSINPTFVAHANDIDILHVSAIPNTGTVSVGQTLEVHLSHPDHMDDVVLGGACTINGKNISTLENLTGGEYRLMYTVADGDTDRAAGQVPLSCALTNAAHQESTLVAFTDSNTVAINGHATTTGGNGGDNGGNNGGNNNAASSTANGTINGNIEGSTGGTNDNAVLTVTSIEQLNSTATAGGGFEHGWKWVFHVTVPTNETSLQMSFDNWMHGNGVNTLAAANNMRISSLQAAGGTQLITGAGVYSAPLTVNGDLNGSQPGRQIDVVVEMQVPSTATNGAYSTSYHVKTLAQ